MKANEIRSMIINVHGIELRKAEFLQEIAAQLADLNESLIKLMDNYEHHETIKEFLK